MPSLYTYDGQARLQLIWETPNHCAVILGMIVLASLALASWMFRMTDSDRVRKKEILYAGGWTAILISIAAAGAVALTYSRGGYVALFIALLAGIGVASKRRWIPGIVLACFFLAIALMPSGSERIADSVRISEDASVGNRFILWKGVAAMSFDHWVTGVGAEAFRDAYTYWYQPSYSSTRYRNAVNDYLTLSAFYGIPVLFLYISGLGTLLWSCFRFGIGKRDDPLLYLGLSVSVFIMAGFFSTFIIESKVVVGLVVAVALVLTRLGLKRSQLNIGWIKHSLAIGLALGFTTAGSVWGVGNMFSRELVALPLDLGMEEAVVAQPRKVDAKGIFIYVSDKERQIVTANTSLRQLTGLGYIAVSPDLKSWGKMGLSQISELIDFLSKNDELKGLPLYIAGHGHGGQLAILAACGEHSEKLKGVVAIASPFSWPFVVLSPEANLKKLKAPLLLIHGELDNEIRLEESRKLLELGKRLRKEVELESYANSRHDLGENWETAFARIDDFAALYR